MIGELGTKTLRDLFGGHISTTQVLQSIASGMADCGVDVVIDPKTDYPYAVVDKRCIYLPPTVKSEKALLVVNWFVDHEASHIIFTPSLKPTIARWQKYGPMLDVIKKHGYEKFPEPLLLAAKSLLNFVEDARIEHCMINKLPGTKKHFIGGPIACDLINMVQERYEESLKAQQENGLAEVPLNPFYYAEMHAFYLLDGSHGQQPLDHVRRIISPSSIDWALDIIEEEFADAKGKNISNVVADELIKMTEKAMARIFDKILEDAEDQKDGEGDDEKEGGEGEGEGDPSRNPMTNKFKKGKKKQQKASGNKGTPLEDSKDGEGEGASKAEGEEAEGEGKGKGDGEGEGDGEDENDDSGSDSDPSDSDEEREGESEDAGDDETDDDEEGDEEESGNAKVTPRETETESTTEDQSSPSPKTVPKQLEEWANDAKSDMAELMRGGGDSENGPGGGDGEGAGVNPLCDHNATISGMPDEYYSKMGRGLRSIVIPSSVIGNNNSQLDEYNDFIHALMPHNLGPAARKLVGKFRAAMGEAWVGTKINPRRMTQIKAGTAYGKKLFVRRNQPIQSRKGVAVMVLMDCSGSMCNEISGMEFSGNNRYWGSKFAVAHAAGRGIARLLQAVNVPFAMTGFTTTDPKQASRHSYGSRSMDLVNLVFKDFHEPWGSCEKKMIAMNTFSTISYNGESFRSHANSDGESVLWAATQLLMREEETKVLIVISDGLPAGGDSTMQSGFLKWVVKRIQMAGVKVGGLGLGGTEVRHYYPVCEAISAFPKGMGTEDSVGLYLQEHIIRLIDRLMTGGVS